jgi:hypothetical protein
MKKGIPIHTRIQPVLTQRGFRMPGGSGPPPPPPPPIECSVPFDADVAGAGVTPFPNAVTNTDPQTFGFALARDLSGPSYTAAPAGTLSMFTGNPDFPFYRPSNFGDIIVLLGAVSLSDVKPTGGGQCHFTLSFGTAGFGANVYIRIWVDGSNNNHSIYVAGENGGGYAVTGIQDNTNIAAVLYMDATTRRIGVVYNGVDLGYQQIEVDLGVFEDMIAPEGNLYAMAQATDSTSEEAVAQSLSFGVTFSKSLMGSGLPSPSVDVCGNGV